MSKCSLVSLYLICLDRRYRKKTILFNFFYPNEFKTAALFFFSSFPFLCLLLIETNISLSPSGHPLNELTAANTVACSHTESGGGHCHPSLFYLPALFVCVSMWCKMPDSPSSLPRSVSVCGKQLRDKVVFAHFI